MYFKNRSMDLFIITCIEPFVKILVLSPLLILFLLKTEPRNIIYIGIGKPDTIPFPVEYVNFDRLRDNSVIQRLPMAA